jgi:hypothetical protein
MLEILKTLPLPLKLNTFKYQYFITDCNDEDFMDVWYNENLNNQKEQVLAIITLINNSIETQLLLKDIYDKLDDDVLKKRIINLIKENA